MFNIEFIRALAFVLVLGVVGAVCFGSNSYAVDVPASVDIRPSLTLNIPKSSIAVILDPSSNAFSSDSINVEVGTNNALGYKLYVTTTDESTDLVHTVDPTEVISTLPSIGDNNCSTGCSEVQFPTNYWGYKINAGNYLPFVSGTLVNSSDGPINSSIATFTVGSKVDYTKDSGIYQTSLQFNALPAAEVYYMQDLSDATLSARICTNDSPAIVIDKRDEQAYLIQRLEDGQCWMVQDLNLAGGTKLYSETSNVPDGYPESAGIGYYILPESNTNGFSNSSIAYVYNSGNITTSQSDCDNDHPCNSYYSWLAATAGGKNESGSSVTGNGPDAAYSICPKNWRLPKSGSRDVPGATSSTNYKKGDFYKLATAYGINLESTYYDSTSTLYDVAGPGTIPNFLLSGYYSYNSLHYVNSYGFYWSSSSYSSSNAYEFELQPNYSAVASKDERYYGHPIRCILIEN